jgi:acetoin utilization deacetylase AcuC-like enzyme
MHIFTSPLQQTQEHQPPYEIFNGEQTPHQEVPARVETILNQLQQTDFEITTVESTTDQMNEAVLEIASQVHSREYLSYLDTTRTVPTNETNNGYLYPSVFNYRSDLPAPTHPGALRGQYSFDLYTPVSNTTFDAAIESANLAVSAVEHVYNSNETAYALCRPPGHHAEQEKMGGYCYLNNGAIAARAFERALTANRDSSQDQVRGVVLDVDFHHGNGTEHIFSQDENVLTVSIHAHPEKMFPFFSGLETPTYTANRNYPLPLGTTDQEYQSTLELAMEQIREFAPDYLVVSYGADTHAQDPIGGFKLTTEYFEQMAHTINTLNVPTVILQEGGYNTSLLGMNVVSFLRGFSE